MRGNLQEKARLLRFTRRDGPLNRDLGGLDNIEMTKGLCYFEVRILSAYAEDHGFCPWMNA